MIIIVKLVTSSPTAYNYSSFIFDSVQIRRWTSAWRRSAPVDVKGLTLYVTQATMVACEVPQSQLALSSLILFLMSLNFTHVYC